jgi:hypothetical protein
MGYGIHGSMRYVPRFPANKVSGLSPPCDMWEYVLPGVWVKRESTVVIAERDVISSFSDGCDQCWSPHISVDLIAKSLSVTIYGLLADNLACRLSMLI